MIPMPPRRVPARPSERAFARCAFSHLQVEEFLHRTYDCLRDLVPLDPLDGSAMDDAEHVPGGAGAKRRRARDPGVHLLAFVALELGGVAGLGNRERLPAYARRGLRPARLAAALDAAPCA